MNDLTQSKKIKIQKSSSHLSLSSNKSREKNISPDKKSQL
jgi:hypothetical protein